MRLALAQINTTVGDLDGNRVRILEAIGEARDAAADLVSHRPVPLFWGCPWDACPPGYPGARGPTPRHRNVWRPPG